MIYEKQNFTEGQVLTAEHVNRIEDAVARVALIAGKVNENCMVLKDQTNGVYYKIYVSDNKLTMIESDASDAPEVDDEWMYTNALETFIERYEKIKRGVDRKLLSITGALADRQKQARSDNEYSYCRVTAVDDGYIDISVSGAAFKRTIRISIAEAATRYEVTRLSGYGFTRETVYSTTAAEKRIIDINIENQRYTDLEILKTVGFEFRNLILNYEVQIDSSNVCLVTLFISPDAISICETVPDGHTPVTSLIGGSYITPIVTHGNNIKVFTVNDGKRYYTERVEQVGNSVIKTFNMKGGF